MKTKTHYGKKSKILLDKKNNNSHDSDEKYVKIKFNSDKNLIFKKRR